MQTLEAKVIISALDKTGKVFGAIGAQARKASTDIMGIARTTRNVGAAMTLGITTPILAFSQSAVRAAAEFESAMADVRKVVDFPTPDAFKRMSEDIRELSLRLPVAAADLAAIAASAGQSGIAAEDLARFTELVAKATVAFELPAERAGEALAKIKTALGLTIPEVELLADAMNTLANNMATSEADVLEVVNRVAALGAVSGVEAKHVAALGAAMSAAGVDAEKAATATRNIFLEMQAGTNATKTQIAAWETLGLNAVEVSKRIQKEGIGVIVDVLERIQQQAPHTRAALLQALFDKRAVDAAGPLLNNLDVLRHALKLVGDEAEYAGSTQREFSVRAETSANNFQLFANALQNFKIVFGNELLPTITELTKSLTGLVNQLARAPEAVKFTVAMAGIAAAIGPVLFGIGQTVLAVGALARAATGLARFAGLGAVLKGVGAGLAAVAAAVSWPVVAAVGALALAGGALWKYWEPVKALVTGIGEGLSSALAPAIKALQPVIDAAGPAFQALGVALSPVAEGFRLVKDAIAGAAEWFGSLLEPVRLGKEELASWTELGRSVGEAIGGLVSGPLASLAEFVAPPLADAFEAIEDAAWAAFHELPALAASAFEGVKAAAKGIWEDLTAGASGAQTALAGAGQGLLDWAGGFASGLIEELAPLGADMWEGIKSGAADLAATLAPMLKPARDAVVQAFRNMKEALAPYFAEIAPHLAPAFDGIVAAAASMLGGVKEKLASARDWLSSAFSTGDAEASGQSWGRAIGKGITTAMRAIPEGIRKLLSIDLADVGKRMIESLMAGIKAAASALLSYVSGLADKVKGLWPSWLGSSAPSVPKPPAAPATSSPVPSLGGSESSVELAGGSGLDRLVASVNDALAASGHGPVARAPAPTFGDRKIEAEFRGNVEAELKGKGQVEVTLRLDERLMLAGMRGRSEGNLAVRTGIDRTAATLPRSPSGNLNAI